MVTDDAWRVDTWQARREDIIAAPSSSLVVQKLWGNQVMERVCDIHQEKST